MKFRRTVFFVLGWSVICGMAVLPASRAAESASAAPPAGTPVESPAGDEARRTGFLNRAGRFFGLGRSEEPVPSEPHQKQERPQKNRYADGLNLRVESPVSAVRLSDSRTLPVRITLKNEGKKPVILKFETSQKIEITLKDAEGKPVVRWSEDRAFAQVRSRLLLNPEERAEYDESISLRDLSPGKTYVLDVGVVGYPDLSYTVAFTPGK